MSVREQLVPRGKYFGCGPTVKRPDFAEYTDPFGVLGSSVFTPQGQALVQEALALTLKLLKCPAGYKAVLLPASDTGAVETFIWSLLGTRPVDCCHFESFGDGWFKTCKSLGIEAHELKGPYGGLPDFSKHNAAHDLVTTFNGTTGGSYINDWSFIPDERDAIVLCDATSAVFSIDVPWSKVDITTYSWQKVLGGEASHGIAILSPRAVQRLEKNPAKRPIPTVYDIRRHLGDLCRGFVIEPPSMLCLTDYMLALKWVESLGGVDGCVAKSKANLAVMEAFVEANKEWIEFLAAPACRSPTSVCCKLATTPANVKKIVALMGSQKAAFDIGAYRDAPPGIRVWCGSTVEAADVAAMLEWLKFCFVTVTAPEKKPAKPAQLPASPNFSSGPCKKRPGFNEYYDANRIAGRSHRHAICKARLKLAITKTLSVLDCPSGYQAGIFGFGDVGTMSAALWSFIGPKPVDIFIPHETSNAATYADEVVRMGVKLYNRYRPQRAGELPPMDSANMHNDVVFQYNCRSASTMVKDVSWIAEDREGLVFCDAGSAAFTTKLPWEKLDVVTFSWLGIGGEGGHSMMVLSPRALQRLKSAAQPRPLPKVFQIKKNLKGVLVGDVINTVSMICVEDYLRSLEWAERSGGITALASRTQTNYKALERVVLSMPKKLDFVAHDQFYRSFSSVGIKLAQGVDLTYLQEKGIAFDLTYGPLQPDRTVTVWCGPTIQTIDIEILGWWLANPDAKPIRRSQL